MADKMAADGSGRKISTTTTTMITSRRDGVARRRKFRKNSRRKQQRPRRPSQQRPTISTTIGNVTSSQTHPYEITTAPTSGCSTGWTMLHPGSRRTINRKLTTAATLKQTGNRYVATSSLSSPVLPLPIATAVPYVNLGAATPVRGDSVTSYDVTSRELPRPWSVVAGRSGTTSIATVVGLAVVSVIAFWLVVTVIVLSCLLSRRSKTRPRRTAGGCGGGGVVDSRWSWSGHQLIGLLDDSVLDAPLENARLFSTANHLDDVSPPTRWNGGNSDERGRGGRTFTAYRSLRQNTSHDDEYHSRAHHQLVDSGYETLAAAAAVLQASEMRATPPPEVTSYMDCEPMAEVWTRQPVPMVTSRVGCSRDDVAMTTTTNSTQLTSQRRFPRMGQSCLGRASTPSRVNSDDVIRPPRLTAAGYIALPRSDTATDVGTTAV